MNMIKPSPSTTRPIHSRVDRNRPKPVNTFARILCEMLYRATPITILTGGWKEFHIRMGDDTAIIRARIISDFTEPPMYEIAEVRFGCESMAEGCTCPTEHFNNITYA